MFETLSTRLQGIFDRLGSRGRLTEDNIQEAVAEILQGGGQGQVVAPATRPHLGPVDA